LKVKVPSAERMGHDHVGILIVVEAGVRRGGEQFGSDKRVQLIMVASLPM
jgi:hypothetical protein